MIEVMISDTTTASSTAIASREIGATKVISSGMLEPTAKEMPAPSPVRTGARADGISSIPYSVSSWAASGSAACSCSATSRARSGVSPRPV